MSMPEVRSAFTITITGPGDYRNVRRFPSDHVVEQALAWVKLLRPEYSADTSEAEAVLAKVQQERLQ